MTKTNRLILYREIIGFYEIRGPHGAVSEDQFHNILTSTMQIKDDWGTANIVVVMECLNVLGSQG